MDLRLQFTRTVSLGALLISAAIMPLCGPAKADEGLLDDPGPFITRESAATFCRHYAEDAMKAVQTNEQHGCFPAKDRWSTDYQAHFDYCAFHETDVSFLQYETSARKAQAENCGYCNSAEFAHDSANRVLENKMFACGLEKKDPGPDPDLWSDDPRVRKYACLYGRLSESKTGPAAPGWSFFDYPRVSYIPVSMKDLEARLQKKVNGSQCKKQKQYDQQATSSCEDYATQAMKLASYNNGYRCGFERTSPPGQWSTNWQFHFNWCIWKDNAPFRAGEQNARMTAMKQCMAEHGDTPDPNDLAFTPVRGGGFHSADQISNIEPPTAIPPSFTPSVNGTIGINPIPFPRGETPRVIPRLAQPTTGTIGIDNRIPYDVFQKPNVPPALGQPANPRTGPNPPRGSSGGGIDTVMNTPPSQPPRMPIPPTGTPSGSPSTPGGNGQAHPSRVPTAKPPTGTVTPTAPPNPRLYPAKPSGTAVATSSGSSSSWRHRITLLRHLRKTKPFTPPLH